MTLFPMGVASRLNFKKFGIFFLSDNQILQISQRKQQKKLYTLYAKDFNFILHENKSSIVIHLLNY